MTRRLLPLLAAIAIAGCATPNPPTETAADPPPERSSVGDAHLALTGTYWMPVNLGMSTSRGNVSFPLNASGLEVTIKLHVGSRALGIDAPASSAMLMAKLVDSSNKTAAEAMVMPPEQDAVITTTNATIGPAQLVLETHGGSDGESNGDYVAYQIAAAPRQT